MDNNNLKYAEFGSRVRARVLDGLIFLLVAIIILFNWNYDNSLIEALIGLMQVIYYTYYHGRYGATIGKKAVGIKVVNLKGGKIGYFRAFWRISSIVLLLCVIEIVAEIIMKVDYRLFARIFLLINILMVLLTKQKRAIHDFLAGTVVISVAEETGESKEGNKLSSKELNSGNPELVKN